MRVGRTETTGRWKGAARGDHERRRIARERTRELREVIAERRRMLQQRHLDAIRRAAEKFDTYA